MTSTTGTRLPRAQRREQLLDVALQQIVTDGFGSLSMEGIARSAGIAKTVVYSQFDNITGLLRTLLQREQDHVAEAIAAAARSLPASSDPATMMVPPMTSILGDIQAHPNTWRLILLSLEGSPQAFRAALDLHRSLVLDQMRPVVGVALTHSRLDHLDIDLVTRSILAAIENAARLVLTNPRQYPPQRIIDLMTDIAVLTAHHE